MKRDGNIIQEITEQSNLEESFDTVVRGTERKNLAEGKWLIAHREEFLAEVGREIERGHVKLGGYHLKHIREAGKVRNIQIFCMADRIKINAVMAVVDKHLHRRYIRTSGASIKGRGVQDLKKRIENDLRQHPDEIKYWYKFDIRKCYDTIKQDFVMEALRRVFKDARLLAILEQFVRLLPGGIGLSMGMRSSQGMCNLLLSMHLDHIIKDRERVKYFYRYCDDGVIGAATKKELWRLRDICHNCIDEVKQEIKATERVFPVEEGLDFLGYVIFPEYTLLRKRVKKTFARKLSKIKSRKRRVEVVGSFYGMAKHADCHKLFRTFFSPREMKKFSELKISYTPADGKKRFPNKAIQLRQLVNVEIEVMDFERDVKTKYGDRWLVKFRDTRTNEIAKFFTDCEEMKLALNAAEQMGEIPFSSVIGVDYFGDNKVKYKFT